jgi:hypothetical protein
VCLSDELALGVIAELTDDSPLATLAQPKLTTVRQRVRERARPRPAWSPCPADRGHGLRLASKIGLDGQPDIRQADGGRKLDGATN